VADRIEFTGLIAPGAVPPLLASADILVLPNLPSSISSRFTSPLKLFEYMAAGRAIVASDLPAIREVLRDGVNAVLVPPGDAEALAAALGRLAQDPALARRIALAAFDDAAQYSWARRAARLEPVLEGAAAS
jgi:glycosyltransferase involved in cell wall biosynthesis